MPCAMAHCRRHEFELLEIGSDFADGSAGSSAVLQQCARLGWHTAGPAPPSGKARPAAEVLLLIAEEVQRI